MIYAIIIIASVVWAALALFSPWFNHLNKENEPVKRTTTSKLELTLNQKTTSLC